MRRIQERKVIQYMVNSPPIPATEQESTFKFYYMPLPMILCHTLIFADALAGACPRARAFSKTPQNTEPPGKKRE